jgi:hypothetical protein
MHEEVENPEWQKVETDKDGRLLGGRKSNGTLVENIGIELSDEATERLKNDLNIHNSTDILELYPPQKMLPILENYKLPDPQFGPRPFDHENLTLMVFGDIHGNGENLYRISKFYNAYKEHIDDVLSCGYFIDGKYGDDFTFWGNNGAGRFLNIMGNHEPMSNVDYTLVSPKVCFNTYLAPFIDSWNVTYVQDKCYWYKDYPNMKSTECPGGIRLIGLDLYHWKETLKTIETTPQVVDTYPDGVHVDTGEQETWFVSVLNDAKNNDMAVMVTLYSPCVNVEKVDCTFDTLDTRTTDSDNCMKADMIQDVQSFIDAGGHFIAWLTGHTHQDMFVKIQNYPDQLIIACNTASYTMTWRTNIKIKDSDAMDDFDIVSIEPKKKYIRLYKVGITHDRHGRFIGSLVYDYVNKRIIFN